MSEILMVNFGDKTKKATSGYLHLRSGHLTVHKRLDKLFFLFILIYQKSVNILKSVT